MDLNKNLYPNLLSPDIKSSKDIKYNWHEDPYGYYNLAKEIELPYHLYEIFSSSLKDPNDEDFPLKVNSAYINSKQKAKLNLNVPIIETIILENGQIIGWINNDKEGYVSKKKLKRIGVNNIINYFLNLIKNFSIDGQRPFESIETSKILYDLQSYASNILHKKEKGNENFFKQNNLEYIYTMEKIKFILIYYYSEKKPSLIDFITFYYLLNELGGINTIKMIQNCINCKFKNSSLITTNSLKESFTKENLSFLYNNNTNKNAESELRKIIVKYTKKSELEPKNFYVYYEKPQIANQTLYNNNNSNNFSNMKNNKYKNIKTTNNKIYINAEAKNNNELNEYDSENQKFKNQEKPGLLNLAENNKTEPEDNPRSFEMAFKYYLKKDKNADLKYFIQMQKIEENLILQNSDILVKTLSILAEKLIKYIERARNVIILNAYFNFVRISDINFPDEDIFAFQKCLLLQGIDKNEPPVIEKRNMIKLNMQNIISKRIPDDVNKFKYFEKFTKNNFCHGEFCNYVVPSFFKGIKEPQNKKYNFKIPKENKISTRNKNNELPEKIPMFEIKKVYDNPDLTNLVLKAYSIFPPNFNKEEIIEKLIKRRIKKDLNQKEKSNDINKSNNEEESKKHINVLEDEYDSILDSYEKISEKIQEYENEFKQEIIVYIPTPGKFLHVDYNDMYSDKGVCQKCYKIYTLILEFLNNIDECTAEFKNLIKAKKFLIKGENLQINNYDEKSGNENNLIIQEELGKTSIKKFLGIKILKLRMDELKKYQKKEKFQLVRNIYTQKKELNKTFNYNIHVNLRLLLSYLLAEKTNNQFFNLLFDEILSDEDSILKHLDLKKPKFNFEKTNLKDLRLQMGISSLQYNTKLNNKSKILTKRNSVMEKMLLTEKEIQTNQILKNYRQQMCQVDKNLFHEYDLLNSTYDENDNIKKMEEKIKLKNRNNNEIIEEIYEYYRTAPGTKMRYPSANDKENKYLNESTFIIDEEENERFNTLQNKKMSVLLKMYKMKNLARRKEGLIKRETKRLNKYNQIKSLEEIKKQKEKQLERFLKFDTKKYKKKTKINEFHDNKSINESLEEHENSSFDESISLDSYKKDKSENDSEKFGENKVKINSIFYKKNSSEFLDINNSPYFYITTPFPKLREFNSNLKINRNPLEILRKMDVEYFLSLGNFKDKLFNKGKSIFNNIKFYSDDNFTSVPYEILNFNESGDFEQNRKRSMFKNAYNNIISSGNQQIENKKKYIVFVLNDFYDSYLKYKNIFKNIILKLKGQYQQMNKNNTLNKKKLNLKLNETNNDLLLNKNSKDKMPFIFNNNNNTNTNNKKEKQNNTKKERISDLKFVLFNLPGQSTSIFTKKNTQNNIYYTEFLDRFIFFLYKEKEFDLSYKIILLGIGNGGQIALTYTSFYEKNWNILESIILFNAYCRNGAIINETMLEILKKVTREKNPKNVETFIKKNIRNPKELNLKEKKVQKTSAFGDEILEKQKLIKKQYLNNNTNINNNINNINENNNIHRKGNKSVSIRIKNYYDNLDVKENEIINNKENDENNMTLEGYKTITRGYFYNIPINLKDINTKILCVHSNVNSFINITNISPIFDNDIASYRTTPLKKIFLNFKNTNKKYLNNQINKSMMGYDLTNFKSDENIKRKLIIFDGSHDITFSSNDDDNIISTTLISYFN